MVARNSKHIERALLRKGFRIHGSHHRFLKHYIGQDPSGITTRLSHGVNDYGDGLLAQVSHQLHLSKSELLQLIDCELSGEEYLALLRRRGHVPGE